MLYTITKTALTATRRKLQHFTAEGESRQTVYNVIRRLDQENRVVLKKKPGRPANVLTPRNENRVRRLFERSPSISVRDAGAKLKLSPSTVSKIKVRRLKIRAKSAPTAPMYTEGQEQRAQEACMDLSNFCAELEGNIWWP